MYRAPTKENPERNRAQPQKTRAGHVAAGFDVTEFSVRAAGVCGDGEARIS